MKELYESINKRYRPEDVLKLIPELTHLCSHVRHSYMRNTFHEVPPIRKPLTTASLLLGWNNPDGLDLFNILHFIEEFERTFCKIVGKNDFKNDRLNKEQRKTAGLGEMSRRRYNKLFRIAARLEKKYNKTKIELEKREFTQISKSRMSSAITWEDFSSDLNTANFIAYYVARCNLRSQFTNQSQDRPYDEICDKLFKKLDERANWWAVALVYPETLVLNHLTEEQKGKLVAVWYDILLRLSKLLKTVWDKSNINRDTMIVRKGNDSSTWNLMAGAWNKGRDAWVSLLYSLGMESILDTICPGKVLRLIAGDVAYWHRSSGGSLDPNTEIWKNVPLPWQVMLGEVSCTKLDLIKICDRYGMDPANSGWVAPLCKNKVNQFKFTPELVHGVTINSPELGELFRKTGVFSGKKSVRYIDEGIVDEVRTSHYLSKPLFAKKSL